MPRQRADRTPVSERPWPDVAALLLERARTQRHPFTGTTFEEVSVALAQLSSTEPEAWVCAFDVPANAHAARGEHLAAAAYWRVARYPAPTSEPKRRAYELARSEYLIASRDFDPPLEQVAIPFAGGAGEGHAIPAHLRLPRGVAQAALVVQWGGIDAFKEDRRGDAYLALGLATLAIDMPGTGESPMSGDAADPERLWDAIFDWAGRRGEIDGSRIAVVGGSTGGYWATRLAHLRSERTRAAVTHGGPAHHAFTAEWIRRSQRGEYPFELAETLAAAFGRCTADEWIAFAPGLSLLDMGILDQPCAPMLLVNGVADTVFPIEDMHLLLAHGHPKAARFFASGHMGQPYRVAEETIARWVAERLSD